jgi:hypothetical protein
MVCFNRSGLALDNIERLASLVLADFVAKAIFASERAILIQDLAKLRDLDLKIYSPRFDCCAFLLTSFSSPTFATQARGHSASDVDRRDRVQLVKEGGCRVASKRGHRGSRNTAGKDVPAGTVAVVRSSNFLRVPEKATAFATLIHQRHLTPSCGGRAPTAERKVGPAMMFAESLKPRPGIREQNREVRGHGADTVERSHEVF